MRVNMEPAIITSIALLISTGQPQAPSATQCVAKQEAAPSPPKPQEPAMFDFFAFWRTF